MSVNAQVEAHRVPHSKQSLSQMLSDVSHECELVSINCLVLSPGHSLMVRLCQWILNVDEQRVAVLDHTSRRGQANDAVEKRPDGEPVLQDEARCSPGQTAQRMKVT